MRRLSDFFWRCGLRLAFPLFRTWSILARPRIRSVHVLVRVGPRLLVVWHSYKRGITAPAGMLKGQEPAAAGAVRELREEVGIRAEVDALNLLLRFETRCEAARDTVHVFELQLAAEPELRIDRREIVAARFLTVDELRAHRPRKTFVEVLDRVGGW